MIQGTEILDIQDSFLKYELSFNGTYALFLKVQNIIRLTRRAKLININETTYEIAENMSKCLSHYTSTKASIGELESSDYVMAEYLKKDITHKLEDGFSAITKLEKGLTNLLNLMVTNRVVTKREASKLVTETKGNILFISEYDLITDYTETDYFLIDFLKTRLPKIMLMMLMSVLLMTGIVDKLIIILVSKLEYIAAAMSTTPDIYSYAPSTEYLKMFETIITILSSVIVGAIILVVLTDLLLSLLYIILPPEIRKQLIKMYPTLSLYFIEGMDKAPVAVKKTKLQYTKDILFSVTKLEPYNNTKVINGLYTLLKDKDDTYVLTLEDNYAICLVESVYKLINQYGETDTEFITYLFNTGDPKGVTSKTDKEIINFVVLKNRLTF